MTVLKSKNIGKLMMIAFVMAVSFTSFSQTTKDTISFSKEAIPIKSIHNANCSVADTISGPARKRVTKVRNKHKRSRELELVNNDSLIKKRVLKTGHY
ncbi:MAG: hypothetical protein BGN92_13675 [Sphingobacteriales bacterium 41-5]|nr:MAG: hypothetical protein BGN92_13675 [Sphingobacteriales bacterium 41-5]